MSQSTVNLKDFRRKMFSVFASTYIWEWTFSVMKRNKSRIMAQMIGEHLSAVFHIATFTPNIEKLVSNCNQHHLSH
jgi:hypothetical protein